VQATVFILYLGRERDERVDGRNQLESYRGGRCRRGI
jgi:hypothetical protein